MKIFQHRTYNDERNKVVTLLIENKWFVSTIDKEDNVIAKKPHHYSLTLTILEKLMGKTTEEKLSKLIEKVSIACDELNEIDNKSDVEFIELVKNNRTEKEISTNEVTSNSEEIKDIPKETKDEDIEDTIEVVKNTIETIEDVIETIEDVIDYANIEDTYEPKEKTVEESDYTELDDAKFIDEEKLSLPDLCVGIEKIIPISKEELHEPEDKLQKILDESSDEAIIPTKHELTKIIKEVAKRKPGRPKGTTKSQETE